MKNERTETLTIASLMRDPAIQMRVGGTSDALAREYAEAMAQGATFPLPKAVSDGVTYWVWDGFHTIQAHEFRGVAQLEVQVTDGTRRDAVLMAVQANASHGARRTSADKRRAIETMLRDGEWGRWSDQKIAAQCHADPKTVGTVRRKLEVSLEIPEMGTRRTVTRGGKTYEMDTGRIGGAVASGSAAVGDAEEPQAARAEPCMGLPLTPSTREGDRVVSSELRQTPRHQQAGTVVPQVAGAVSTEDEGDQLVLDEDHGDDVVATPDDGDDTVGGPVDGDYSAGTPVDVGAPPVERGVVIDDVVAVPGPDAADAISIAGPQGAGAGSDPDEVVDPVQLPAVLDGMDAELVAFVCSNPLARQIVSRLDDTLPDPVTFVSDLCWSLGARPSGLVKAHLQPSWVRPYLLLALGRLTSFKPGLEVKHTIAKKAVRQLLPVDLTGAAEDVVDRQIMYSWRNSTTRSQGDNLQPVVLTMSMRRGRWGLTPAGVELALAYDAKLGEGEPIG